MHIAVSCVRRWTFLSWKTASSTRPLRNLIRRTQIGERSLNLIDAEWGRLMQGTTTTKQLRSFGLMVGGIFATIGLLPVLLHGRDLRLWTVVIAGLLVIPALVYPKSLKLIYRGWMAVGQVLGWINTRIILSVIFYGLITPFGLVRRLLAGDPMNRRFQSNVDTYRVESKTRPASHMKQQF